MPTRKTKTAAQRLAGLDTYSSAVSPNPLVTLREDQNEGEGFTVQEMAEWLGVNKATVFMSEDATFSLIPTAYRFKLKNIYPVNQAYQLHRKEKRLYFYDPVDFPDHPARTQPVTELMKHFNMNRYQFSKTSCVNVAEIWKMINTKPVMTSNFHDFLTTIGIDKDWIDEFNASLKRDNYKPRVRLAAGRSKSS